MLTEKKCNICKKVKPISEFYRDARRKDGLCSKCKLCHAKAVKKWQTNNAEKFKEINRNWKKTHPKQHYQHQKNWVNTHEDKARQVSRSWRERNPEYGRDWRKNNRDKIQNYEQKRRARLAEVGGDLTVDEWEAIQEYFGHKCLCCGREDVKLTIDHVLPISLGGSHTADNIQPLCGPCNSSKRDKHIDYRKEYYYETSRD